MDFNIADKVFSVDLAEKDSFYLDQVYWERNLNEIYQQLNPELRDADYAPFPYFHPSKTDKVNNKFTSMNGLLSQIKMYWDEVTFEEGLNNIITLIYIDDAKKAYNRRSLIVSEREKRRPYESK